MASKAIGFLNFKFSADLTSFERAMKKAQKNLKKFGKNVTKAGQNLSRNLTLPILALGAASIKAFDEQAKAEQKLLTSLKGREDIQQRLIEQAKELQKTTLFGDEATIAAQSMLAMMGLTEEEVVKLIPLIQDFATAKGMDLVTAADLVAKSMGSSTNALSRYGIEITGAVGSSERLDTAVNQLTEKFEGQAKAAALVGAGPLIQIGNQLGDISEQLGGRLMPYVTKFVDYLKTLISKFDGLTESQKDNIVKWGLILAAIGPVLIIIGKISIGIAALMPLLTTLGKVMLRHPLITAFTLASVGIYKMVKAWKSLKEVESAESILAKRRLELQKQVNAETKLEIDQINEKVGIARDAEASDKDRMSAVKFLNTEIKGLNGQLTLENINTKSTTDSINKHTEAIIANAKAAGAKKQLEQAVMDLEEAERLYSVAFKFHMKNAKLAGKDFMGQVDYAEKMISPSKQKDIDEAQKVVDALVAMIKEVEKVGSELNAPRTFDEIMITKYANSINGLNEKMSDLQFVMNDATKGSEDYNKAAKEIVNTQKELDKMYSATTSTVVGSGEDYSRALDPLLAQIKDYSETMTVMGASMFLVETRTEALTEAQKQYNATVGLFKDIMFTAMMDATNSQENFFNSFIKNMKKAIKQLLIQLAVMTALNILLGGPTITIAKAFSAAKLDILGFAEGGLVTGPTTALIGEGVGTTASNPEVVAPLDKLKQYMGGGNQNIIVEGVLKGNDIYLSNRNTSINRLRTT